MLVLAAYLEKIEEVGCGSVNCDKVFVGLRCGCWEVDYFELLRALDLLLNAKGYRREVHAYLHIFLDLDGFHVVV